MRTAIVFKPDQVRTLENHLISESPTRVSLNSLPKVADEIPTRSSYRRFITTKELSEIWGIPESTLRYWRGAEIGPPYVKLGGRIKYDLVDVEHYVRVNKRMPSVRAHGG